MAFVITFLGIAGVMGFIAAMLAIRALVRAFL